MTADPTRSPAAPGGYGIGIAFQTSKERHGLD